MKKKALCARGLCKGIDLPLALKAIRIVEKERGKKKIREAITIGLYHVLILNERNDDVLANIILEKSMYSQKEYRQIRKTVDRKIAKNLKLHREAIYIYSFCEGAKIPIAQKALLLACRLHKGRKRDDGRDYVEHVLEVCRYLLNFGIRDGIILAAALLHDTVEDKHITLSLLAKRIGKEVAYLVDLLTKYVHETIKEYYDKIKQDVRAIIIKAADRTSNVSDMIRSFTLERLINYIEETEKIILPMMKEARKMHSEYSDILVILRDRIISVLLPIKEVVRLRQILNNHSIQS